MTDREDDDEEEREEQQEIDFDAPAAWARSSDPDTSHDAAEGVRGSRASYLQRVVLETLVKLGGEGTSEEVADACGIDLQSITPRFRPLCKLGLIEETGKRRLGKRARPRIVWRVKRMIV